MHPILFKIGTFSLHTYGVVLMVALAVAIYRACRAADRPPVARVTRESMPYAVETRTIPTEADSAATSGRPTSNDILDSSLWMVVAGIIGARAVFVAEEWPLYRGHPSTWLAVWEGGISFHGALLGGLLAAVVYTIRHRLAFLKLLDVISPSVMIGYAIGRVGCFFNGCCYGAPTRLPWGVRFYDDGHWTPPSHPTQLYSTILSLIFFAVLVRIERHKAFDGQIFAWYLIFAGIERFIMEIWRAGYTSDVFALGLTDVQFLCIGLVVCGAVMLPILRRRSAARTSEPATLGATTP
ncbi:MAG: prolipoprotein diacylglyceryl transferase [Capsulimonadaceae bacterium]